jgi:hypothetical protein
VSKNTPPAAAGTAPVQRRSVWCLAGVALLVVTAVLIVIAVVSVIDVLARSPRDSIYLLSGAPPPAPSGASQAPVDAYTLHVAVESLDEAKELATMRVYTSRACPTTCPAAAITLFALGGPAAQQLGLPPQGSVAVPPNTQQGSGTVQLPVRAEPTLYPFDAPELVLGVVVEQARPDGTMAPMTPAAGGPTTYSGLRSQLQGLLMAEPVPVDPSSVRASVDPSALLYVRALHFRRPLYLQVLTVLLVGLISAAAAYSVRTQPIPQLFLGLGGLILGVWGIRGVLLAGGRLT